MERFRMIENDPQLSEECYNESVLTRSSSLKHFTAIRKRSNELVAPLYIEDYIPQPAEFVSPPKWHLAHTTWFFEVFILVPYCRGYRIFHEQFSFLFNSYYNGVGDRVHRFSRGSITRPTVEEVMQYRSYVDGHIIDWLSKEESLTQEVLELIRLGLNHEQQHQELLITDLKYTFAQNPLFPVYQDGYSLIDHAPDHAGTYTLDEGLYPIGYRGEGFHWDNERDPHQVYLQETRIERQLVTQGEYVAFIEDGAYENPALWHDEGWTYLHKNQHQLPMYWEKRDGEYWQYTLSGLKPINPALHMCHVNFYEAAAFAEWSGKRLPTEFEWESATDQLSHGTRWEWTESAYLPYPGFRKPAGAIGEYNGKFMVNQKVLRGSSTATPPGHSRATYRNFFHPNYSWQCMGIRLTSK